MQDRDSLSGRTVPCESCGYFACAQATETENETQRRELLLPRSNEPIRPRFSLCNGATVLISAAADVAFVKLLGENRITLDDSWFHLADNSFGIAQLAKFRQDHDNSRHLRLVKTEHDGFSRR